MREITQQQSSWKYLNPFSALWGIWKGRDLLNQLVRRNIEVRYKGTMMGLTWMVLPPLVMLAVYTFVFRLVFKVRWGAEFGDSKAAFALIMFCGMTVFNIFSESVNGSVGIITGNPNYVKKVIFPLELLPVSAVMSACFFGLVWIVTLLSMAVFQLGYFWFMKTNRGFADVL